MTLPIALWPARHKSIAARSTLRKIARQQRPRRRRLQNVEEDVDNATKRNYSRSSQGLLPRRVRQNQRPFRIRHVTCIAQIFPPILLPKVSVHILYPPCRLTQLGYHKDLKSLNSFRAKL